jgi:ABC 3 transport family
LLFGFLVLPALAARPLVNNMSSFLWLSSLLGLAMAVFGFYSSVRLDLPLGPTDVALGCCLIFLAYALRRISPRRALGLLFLTSFALWTYGCGTTTPATPLPEAKALKNETLWLAKVKNNSGLSLLLPATNPLRSLAEMAGKISSDYRQSVMDLLREDLRRELDQRGFHITLPEQTDARFPAFPADTSNAVRLAREGKLSGLIFVSEISRWEADSRQFVRVFADFKLIRTEDGAVLWERRIQRAVPTPSATNLGQAYTDSVKEVVRDLFAG